MNNTNCKHDKLVLLPAEAEKVRCLHCHLTIKTKDLDKGYCPECYAIHGKKHYDFEQLPPEKSDTIRYRCENCGLLIDA